MGSIYGRRAQIDADLGTMANQLRSSVYLPAVENGWAYRWGMHAGDASSGSPYPIVRGEIHIADPTPSALHGYTDTVTVTKHMPNGTTPSEVTAPLVDIVPVSVGQAYAIGAAAVNATLIHGMIQSAQMPSGGQDRRFYSRSISGSGPHDPHGYTSASIQGWMTAWFEYQPNRPPTTTLIGPLGDIDGQPAAFTGTFADPDQTIDGRANPAERMSAYRIQLRRELDGALLWDDLYTASSAEQAANAFTQVYAGSAPLDPGEPYAWRAQAADWHGTPSEWTGWQGFTIVAAGSVSRDGDGGVAGRQTTQQPGPFLVTYQHVDGLDAVEHHLQILQGGAVVRDETIAATWAPGTHAVTPSWGAAFPALPWSTPFTWRVRARDTNGDLTSWSPLTAFNTNYRPGTPSGLQPAGGVVASGFPELSFQMSDQDNTPATGLVADVRIVDASSAFVERSATFRDGRWRYQTDAADLPATGPYSWYARGRDGTLTGDWSATADFYYAQQPVVVTPQPGAAVISTTLEVSYAITGQVARRALLFSAGGSVAVYVTAWETTASTTLAIDMALFAVNGADYELMIEVELPGSIVSRSVRVPFELILDAGHSVELLTARSGPIVLAGDPEPTAIGLVRGAIVGITEANFRAWRIKEGPPEWVADWDALAASPPADPAEALRAKVRLAAELRTAAESVTFSDLTFTHFEPRLGVARSYALTAVIQSGPLNRIESLPVGAIVATCEASGIVIHDTREPTARRVFLAYLDAGSGQEVGDKHVFAPWSDGPGVVLETGLAYEELSERYRLRPQGGEPARVTYERVQALARYRPDGSPVLVCHRDDTGARRWGRVMEVGYERRRLGGLDIAVAFTETRR